MLKSTNAAITLMAMGAFLIGLTACQKRPVSAEEQGPAQRAGQHIDKAAAVAGQALNKAAEKTGKGLQELGQKIQDEAQQAQQKK